MYSAENNLCSAGLQQIRSVIHMRRKWVMGVGIAVGCLWGLIPAPHLLETPSQVPGAWMLSETWA